jgi:type VI protein secretion system component Hcp
MVAAGDEFKRRGLPPRFIGVAAMTTSSIPGDCVSWRECRRRHRSAPRFFSHRLSNVQIASFATENSWQDTFALSFDALRYAFVPLAIKKGTASPVTSHWNRSATGSEIFLVPKGKPEAILPTDMRVLVKIAGTSGSSQLKDYVGWIELESVRVEAYRPLCGQLSAPVLSTFQFVSPGGLASPQLMQALADGQIFSGKEAIQVVTLRQLKDGSVHELARWSLDDASLTSLANHSARQDGFSVAYGELNFTYTPISSNHGDLAR